MFVIFRRKKDDEWEYGTAGNNDRPARRHKKNGNVQFVLWKAGEQGHKEDYWHNFDPYWWHTFRSSQRSQPMNSLDHDSIKAAIIAESARWDVGCQNTPAAWLALRDFAESIGINVTPDEQYKASLSRMGSGQ